MLLVVPERDLNVPHPKQAVDLKTPAVDETVSRQHHANVMTHRFQGLGQTPGNFPDTSGLNEWFCLCGNKEDAYWPWHGIAEKCGIY
jgi:hypothetical protein